ncbi:MAG TPA: efflux RND transporter periplasmic adaptor subunit [Candidatus Binataceae bacterium]|nr:efflux RND transporter periplasmic adaptor subunit [Candidatus Binataceae bacterium]
MAATLLGLLALAGCDGGRLKPAQAQEPQVSVLPELLRQPDGIEAMRLPSHIEGLTLAEVHNVLQPGVLETTGKISFDDRRVATIASRVAGRVEQVWVSQWDNVRRGQPIVTLYSPDYMTGEAEYLQARATAQMKLGPDASELGASMVAAAQRKLELLGLPPEEIAALRVPSATTVVRAPIAGTVVEKKVLRGALVNPGDQLFTVGTLEQVWITADVYEDDLARVRVGQQLIAETPAFPGELFKGVVARISPAIDPDTHTAQLRCQVANPGLKLKPEMLARVRIVTRPGQALVVPQAALVFDVNAYFAYVETAPGRVVRRRVTIGPWGREGYVRVLSGLVAGDRVVEGESIQVDTLWHQAHGVGA